MKQETGDSLSAIRRTLGQLQHDVEDLKARFDLGEELRLWQELSLDSLARWEAEHLDDDERRGMVE